MIKSIFTPVKMPLVKTDLVDPTGRPTQDLVTAFKSLEEPTPDTTLIFQEKDDLLHWIYENYSTTTQSI